MSEPPDDEVRQLVVHPAAWDALVEWFASRRIDIVQIPSEPDDLPTFILSPRDFGPTP
jgi:hypothetical protein